MSEPPANSARMAGTLGLNPPYLRRRAEFTRDQVARRKSVPPGNYVLHLRSRQKARFPRFLDYRKASHPCSVLSPQFALTNRTLSSWYFPPRVLRIPFAAQSGFPDHKWIPQAVAAGALDLLWVHDREEWYSLVSCAR